MKLKLGFSTCPNDTFMFDALVHQKIDTKGLSFDIFLADIEELNQLAMSEELDITKMSYAAYINVSDKYIFLRSGSALGKNNGPILISKRKIFPDEVDLLKIAIPGKLTTANMLLSIAYPNAIQKQEYLFSDIEEAILTDEVDAGLIIHENRFTYEKNGLKKIVDLGEYWEENMKSPIPLGGIAIKRNIVSEIQKNVNISLKLSIKYAFENKNSVMPFIRKHAQELKDEVIWKHINLYVNDYSIDIGEEGKNAIETFYNRVIDLKLADHIQYPIFVEN